MQTMSDLSAFSTTTNVSTQLVRWVTYFITSMLSIRFSCSLNHCLSEMGIHLAGTARRSIPFNSVFSFIRFSCSLNHCLSEMGIHLAGTARRSISFNSVFSFIRFSCSLESLFEWNGNPSSWNCKTFDSIQFSVFSFIRFSCSLNHCLSEMGIHQAGTARRSIPFNSVFSFIRFSCSLNHCLSEMGIHLAVRSWIPFLNTFLEYLP